MNKNHDPASAPEDKFLDNHDKLKNNKNAPEVAALNLSTEDKAVIDTDNTALHLSKTESDQADSVAQQKTKVKNDTFTGGRKRYRDIRQRIVKSAGYTDAIGELLGIVRTEGAAEGQFAETGPTAEMRGKPAPAGGAELKCKKNGADAVDIYGKRDPETAFSLVMRVLQFPWVDNRPVLVPGKPEARQYYAQLIKGNSPIGQPSPIITVVVPG